MKKLIYRVPLKALQTIPLLICVFWYLNRTMFGGMHDMIIMAIFIGCLILSFALTRFKQIQLLRMCIYAGTAVIGLTIFYTFILYWQRHLPVSPKWQDIARLLSSTDRRLAELNLQLLPWVSIIFGLVGSALFVYEIFNISFSGFSRTRNRTRSESDLYGNSSLLEIAKVRALSKPPGVMLGVESRRARSKIVSYPLEGAMVTIAQPRTGKSSLIAANLLNPNNGGLQGSVVYIDLRSEGWFVTSDKRKQDKRNVVLIDPFGLVEQNAKAFPELKHHIGQKVDRYNPLDFVRRDKNAVEDIGVLLQAILTPPKSGGSASAQHFYESCEAIIGGLIAWVIFSNEPNKTLARVRELLLQEKQAMDTLSEMVGESQDLGFGMPWEAIRRLNSAGDSESGSNLSSVANQLSFLKYPAVQQSMSVSTFNPEVLVDGNTDLYVVAPDNLVGEIKGWIRLWVTIPNAVPNRTPFKMKMLMIIDELPKIGFLQPVMDAYSMAAGKGVLFWTLIQSVSALEASWGKAAAKVILDLAEVIQVLGTPLGSTEDAEQLSRVIGEATYETHTESQSGTVSGTSVVGGRQSSQEGLSTALVRGRAVPTDMIQNLAADEQIVVTGSKIHKGAFKIILMKYWTHTSCKNLFGLNPFVLKDMSEEDRKKAHDKILKRQEKTYTPVKRST